jgi:hypothetical protein
VKKQNHGFFLGMALLSSVISSHGFAADQNGHESTAKFEEASEKTVSEKSASEKSSHEKSTPEKTAPEKSQSEKSANEKPATSGAQSGNSVPDQEKNANSPDVSSKGPRDALPDPATQSREQAGTSGSEAVPSARDAGSAATGAGSGQVPGVALHRNADVPVKPVPSLQVRPNR